MESLKTYILNAQSQPDEAAAMLNNQNMEETNRTISMEQDMVSQQSQLWNNAKKLCKGSFWKNPKQCKTASLIDNSKNCVRKISNSK
jgi:hypothetical protein